MDHGPGVPAAEREGSSGGSGVTTDAAPGAPGSACR